MSPALEVAALGVLFGAVLMPLLYVLTDRALGYLERRRGVDAREILTAED